MTKQAILDISQGIYLVKLDSASRKPLITQNLDAFQLWSNMFDLSNRMGTDIIAYCFNDSSIIILYQANESPAPFLQNFINEYTRWYNRTHHKRGSLFQAEYQFVLIEPGDYLLDAFHWVHNYPVLHDLAPNAETVEHSSYSEYSSNRNNTLLATKLVESKIGQHDTMFNRRLNDFIHQPANYDEAQLLTGNQETHYAYCSEKYLEALSGKQEISTNALSLENVIDFVCKLYQFKPVQINTMRRHRLMPEIKGMICYFCKAYDIASSSEVKEVLSLDEFDYNRGLRLVDLLSDVTRYERKIAFEQLLLHTNRPLPAANSDASADTLSDQQQITPPDNVHQLAMSITQALTNPPLDSSPNDTKTTDTDQPSSSSKAV